MNLRVQNATRRRFVFVECKIRPVRTQQTFVTRRPFCLRRFKKLCLWWLDTVFQGQYLPSLSINYVAIKKVLEKLPPQLYYIKMKICYDQGCNGIGVVIATKSRYYLFYLQQCISALRTVLPKSFTGAFSSNSSLDVREV